MINIWNRSFYAKLVKPDNWIFWFTLALLVRSIFFLFKVFTEPNTAVHYPGTFASEAPDTISYFGPIDNLLRLGTYSDDHRMPGYGWIYFLLRMFLPVASSLNIIALLQLVLASLSVYVLAKLAHKAFSDEFCFYGVFLTFVFSTYSALWDHVLLTESFCTSALIFSLYFLIDVRNSRKRIFLSGLFLTWSIFLRPVTVPLLGLFTLYLFFKNWGPPNGRLALNWKAVILFVAPFLTLDGLWTVRNLHVYKGVYPLMTTVGYKGEKESYFGALLRFIPAFGGSTVYWAPGAEITFFIPLPAHIKAHNTVVNFPNYIFTSKFNYENLVEIQRQIATILDKSTPSDRKLVIEHDVIQRLDSYTASIKIEKPVLFHILSRLRIAKTFLVHSGTYNLFSRPSFQLNRMEMAIKIFYSIVYVLVVLLGFLGSFMLLARLDIDCALLSLSTVFLALVHPIIFRMDEFRYLTPGYPFLLLAAVFCCTRVVSNK